MNFGRLFGGSAIALCFAASIVNAACAQAAAPTDDTITEPTATPSTPDAYAPDAASNGDIVVTARRREESLQDIPAAVTAVSGDLIQSKAATDLRQLNGIAPNVNIQATSNSATAAAVYIRGIGNDNFAFNVEANIGLYLDDVYIGRSTGSLIGVGQLDRIEVLRGPQGTLYGRNSTGGAIKYVTRKPDLDDTYARVAATVGSERRADVKGSVNIPLISGELALLVSAQTRNDDGYMHLVDRAGRRTGERANQTHADDFRAALRWQPNATLTADLAIDYSRDRSGRQAATPTACQREKLNGQFVRCPLFYGDAYTTFFELPSSIPRYDGGGIALTLAQDMGFATVRSITAYRDSRDTALISATGKYVPVPGDTTNTSENAIKVDLVQRLKPRQFTQEFQLASDGDGLIGYVAGLFYYHERISSYYNLNFATITGAGSVVRSKTLNFDEQTSESYAAYGELYVRPLEGLELTLGGRMTWDRKSIDRSFYANPASLTIDQSTLTPNTTYSGSIKSKKFTPKIGLSYDAGPVLVYGSFTEGYRPGGYSNTSGGTVAALSLTVDQETIKSYEVGLKGNLWDNLLSYNFAAFKSNYQNLQASATGPNGDGIVVSADVALKGFEAELTLRPAQGLTLFGNVGLLHNKFTTPIQGQPFAKRLKFAPNTTFLVGMNYEHELGSVPGTFFIGGDLQYTGPRIQSLSNTVDQSGDAVRRATARIGYRAPDDRWTITLGGTNLLNEKYWLLGSSLQARAFDPPRRFYLTGEIRL